MEAEIKTFDEKQKVDVRALPIQYKLGGDSGDCWVCVSHASYKGHYPLIKRRIHGRRLHTSLIRYIMEVTLERRIEEGKVIMHSCDNKLCINPEHLSEGTPKENSEDMVSKGRTNTPREFRLPQTKLSNEQVREIRKLSKEGLSNRELAEKYKVSIGHIQDIVTLKKRKNA